MTLKTIHQCNMFGSMSYISNVVILQHTKPKVIRNKKVETASNDKKTEEKHDGPPEDDSFV